LKRTNAFTIDVEDYFQGEAMADVISRDSWSHTNLSRCEQRLGRLLDEFAFAPMREVLSSTAVGEAVRAWG
jgi:hypothetical protein